MADFLYVIDLFASLEFHHKDFAVAADLSLQPFAKSIDNRCAYTVQASRDLVRVVVELSAGMEMT